MATGDVEITFTAVNGFGYFRSAKGSKRHASWYCINSRRRVSSGDPIRIPPTEVKNWEPCVVCCTNEPVAEVAEITKPAKCPNSGIDNPGSRRIYDKCRDCGKEGKVNRRTGTIRAHEPQA